MKVPVLKIGEKVATMPIVQGGMAIRLSTARLAASVANEGGVGLIAASGLPFDELRKEIRLARKLSNGKGMIGINAMVAAREFKGLITTAAQEKVDLIVAGAGFSRDMFSVGREYNVPIVPIVSYAKLAKIAERLGASAVVVEGTEAGAIWDPAFHQRYPAGDPFGGEDSSHCGWWRCLRICSPKVFSSQRSIRYCPKATASPVFKLIHFFRNLFRSSRKIFFLSNGTFCQAAAFFPLQKILHILFRYQPFFTKLLQT